MRRQIINQLHKWKASPRRKPLLLMGARQVGKTTALRTFGQSAYRNVVTLNFDDQPSLKKLFVQDLKPDRLIRDISLEFNTVITPGETLLFFDEIQECPEALNSLKYFHENANEYHVCGAGSLLGVKLSHTKGFPVGQVHFEKLFPLNFLEFLDAIGETYLSEYLSSVTLHEKINAAIHEKCIHYLKKYLLIGGMPEAVQAYIDTQDFAAAREVHHEILRAYDLDFMKHAPSNIVMRITDCFHSIGGQLAKENKKFIYSVIREGARARDYEDALQWLVEANLFHKVYRITTPKLPVRAYEELSYFKVYFCDTGLLNTLTNLPMNIVLQEHQLFQEFHGALTENFVAQELSATEEQLHFWASDNRAEIDFVLQREENIYPIEVKSGFSKHKKSLMLYNEKFHPRKLIRISPNNLEQQENFVNIPLYLMTRLCALLLSP